MPLNITQIQANSLAELPEEHRFQIIANLIDNAHQALFEVLTLVKKEDFEKYSAEVRDCVKDLPDGDPEKRISNEVVAFIGVLETTRAELSEKCLSRNELNEIQRERMERKEPCMCPKCRARREGEGLAG